MNIKTYDLKKKSAPRKTSQLRDIILSNINIGIFYE